MKLFVFDHPRAVDLAVKLACGNRDGAHRVKVSPARFVHTACVAPVQSLETRVTGHLFRRGSGKRERAGGINQPCVISGEGPPEQTERMGNMENLFDVLNGNGADAGSTDAVNGKEKANTESISGNGAGGQTQSDHS